MYNPGLPNCNGSQFMITFPNVRPEALDGTHVAFGQVLEGWNVLAALEQLGDARQEGDTFQRVTIEQCGVLKKSSGGAPTTAAMGGASERGGPRRRMARRAAPRAETRKSLRSFRNAAPSHGAIRAIAARVAYAA